MKQIGITGCGAIGALHARNLRTHGAELWLHNRTRDKAEQLCRQVSGEGVCNTYEELVSRCDAVVIATPPEIHSDQLIAALISGKHCLVEKPLCASEAELRRIEDAAAASSAFVMVAENYYYKPSLSLMKEIVGWGGVGRVRSIHSGKRTQQEVSGWKSSYGALLEGGVHFVALISDLADTALASDPDAPTIRYPVQITADFPTASSPERRSQSVWTYENAGESLEAHLEYAWDVPSLTKGTFQHSRIEGDEGRIVFESNGIYLHTRGSGRRGLSFPGMSDLMGYQGMTRDFIACLKAPDERQPYSNLERAFRDLEIVFTAYVHLP
ncbi:MAG: Gfo/Idh/MocA family oxidoreductase [Candidatus Latescibacterota bacterium]|nr:Gfo/Idh/MocA family oxidoreductase [Candidatus Latescibacterota bacterium]